MPFTSPVFLFFLLPIALAIYQLIPIKLRNIYLLSISIIFYGWTEWDFLPFILGSIFINWSLSYCIQRFPNQKKIFLGMGILQSVGLLVYSRLSVAHLGLSFFTFHSISYLVDVFKNKARPTSLINLGVYSIFFPQVTAGPINRYANMHHQLVDQSTIAGPSISSGIEQFIIGLSQKMLLASTLGILADQVFGFAASDISFGLSWLGIVAYTLQIYFDFAGYSNMAIGLGRMFGYELSENFNLPYISRSITEFWTRWHISLTSWLREYIYFPLGGSRAGQVRTYLNILIVFLISGIWHGAGWQFVAWGMWHGLFMVFEKYFDITKSKISAVVMHVYTLLVVMFGWVLFRSSSISSAIQYIQILLGKNIGSYGIVDWLSYMTPYTIFIFVLSIALALGYKFSLPQKYVLVRVIGLCLLLLLSLLKVASSTYTPFIYAKF